MSWSCNKQGKAHALATAFAADLARIKCVEPEETIKNKVAEVVADALGAMAPGQAVLIEANGSQSRQPDGTFLNSLHVSIRPMYGFVE